MTPDTKRYAQSTATPKGCKHDGTLLMGECDCQTPSPELNSEERAERKRVFVTTPNPAGPRRWLIEHTDYSTNVFAPRDQPHGRSEVVEVIEVESAGELLDALRELVRATDALPGHTALPVVQADYRNALDAARSALTRYQEGEG